MIVKKSNIVRIVIWGAVAIAAVVVLYYRFARTHASQAIADANALSDEGDDAEKKLGMNEQQLLRGYIPKAFYVEQAASKAPKTTAAADSAKKASPLDRAKLKTAIDGMDGALTEAAEKYRAAADKFESGKRSGQGEMVAKYLDIFSQAYKTRADAEEAKRKALAALVDTSLPSDEERQKEYKKLIEDVRKSEQEFERLVSQGEKLQKENKSSFK